MPYALNIFTGLFDYYYRDTDISGGLDNLLLEDGTFLLLETGTEDVLLLE